VARMFDPMVYKRGALTLHALRTKMGDPPFFALLRSWVAEHQHGTVTTDEFRAHARRFARGPIDDLLTAWLDRTALPALPIFGL
jgi:aminopeptidase N